MMNRQASLPPFIALVIVAASTVLPGVARADGPVVPVDYTPPPAAAPVASEPPADSGPPRRVVAFVAAGAAVVGVGVGTAFGVLALDSKSKFDAHPTVALANTGNEQATLSDVGFGAAVIAGVTSLVLFLKRDEPQPAPAGSLTLSPMVSSHGGGAGALFRF